MKAICYYRVSSKQQAERQSIALQKSRLHKFAKQKGYKIVAEYQDDGISGEEIDRRPGFKKVLEAIGAKEADVLLVFMVDRIGRFKKRRDRHFITQLLEDSEVSVDSPYHGFYDCRSEEDLNRLEADLVESRRDNKMRGIRISEGHMETRRQGGFSGGQLPYGINYDKQTKEFSIDEKRHEALRKMLELLTEGWGLQKVARFLNSDLNKYPLFERRNRKGKRWWPGTVRNMVTNDFYFTGILGREDGKATCGEDLLQVDTGLRLFKEEEVKAARRKMEERHSYDKKSRKERKPDFLLAGMLKCGECGHTVGPHTSPRSNGREPLRYYRCRGYASGLCGQKNGYRADGLEVTVWDEVVEKFFNDPKALETAVLAEEFIPDADRSKLKALVESAERELLALEEERKKVLNQNQKGYISDEELDEKMEEILTQKAQAGEELLMVQLQLERPAEIKTAINEATQALVDDINLYRLLEEWDKLFFDEIIKLPPAERECIEREQPNHPYVQVNRKLEELNARNPHLMHEKLWDDEVYEGPTLKERTNRLIILQKLGILEKILGPEGYIKLMRGERKGVRLEIVGSITHPENPTQVFSKQPM